jgi:hypothetical protein
VSIFGYFGTTLKYKNYVKLEVSAAMEIDQIFLDDFKTQTKIDDTFNRPMGSPCYASVQLLLSVSM